LVIRDLYLLRAGFDMKYLAFYIDSFSPDNYQPRFWVLDDSSDTIKEMNPNEISQITVPLITIEPQKLIRFCSKLKISLPRQIIDLSLIHKICVGRPKSDFSEPLPWDFASYLKPYLGEETLSRLLDFSMSTREPEIGELNRIFSSTAMALKKHFQGLLEVERDANGRSYKSFEYEIQMANIFYRIQYDGVRICQSTADSKLTALEDEYYTKLQELRDNSNFKGGVFDTSYISEYLGEHSEYYNHFQNTYDIGAYLEGFHHVDSVASDLHELRKIRLTLSSLLKAVGSKFG